jgi:hypothetical protein
MSNPWQAKMSALPPDEANTCSKLSGERYHRDGARFAPAVACSNAPSAQVRISERTKCGASPHLTTMTVHGASAMTRLIVLPMIRL